MTHLLSILLLLPLITTAFKPPSPADNLGVILLAGGKGSRMKSTVPKQFLLLNGKPIVQHSIDLFLNTLNVPKIVMVMDEQFRSDYTNPRIIFADPGEERQDSVKSGLVALTNFLPATTIVAVHDSARPLVTPQEVTNVISDARLFGASVLGVACKATIKQVEFDNEDIQFVKRTIPRETLIEVHTPQCVEIGLLKEGFNRAAKDSWVVTDDVSLVEGLGEKVKVTKGEYTNIKVTTPEDLEVAEAILRDREGGGKGGVGLKKSSLWRRIIGK